MRRINENEFVNYTIVANGWSLTLGQASKAKREYDGLTCSATLYGNKPDGTQIMLENK